MNRSLKFNFLFLFCFLSFYSFAFAPQDTIIGDSSEESFIGDSLRKIFKEYIPEIHDNDLIMDRLACIEGDIPLTYHEEMLGFITLYTTRRREFTEEILERQGYYFPLFEEIFPQYGIPKEMKYLSVVESALKPRIMSWASAGGLWQFIPSTGSAYGLHQDWYIDERFDPHKSTHAACRYLKDLYRMFDNWPLAMAAYNCGPGRVRYAIRTTGGDSFWDVYYSLPRETRAYVPMYIAVAYALNYSEEHNIYAQPDEYFQSDTILVDQFLSIETFGDQIDVPFDVMQKLNPHLLKNVIPKYMHNYPIRFPKNKREEVDANRQKILLAALNLPDRVPEMVIGEDNYTTQVNQKTKVMHTIQEGDTLPLIALNYGVTVSDIKIWNRIIGEELDTKELIIWI